MSQVEVKKENKDKSSLVNLIFTIVQIVLIVVCVVASIFIIINPSRYRAKAEDCNTSVMVVMSDSMEPTISTNDIIFGKDVPDGILPLGTVVTFAVKSNEGYYLNTHRIVGYRYEYINENNEPKQGNIYYIKDKVENENDLDPNWEILGYVTRGDKYTEQYCESWDDFNIYENGEIVYAKDDAGFRKLDGDVLAVWDGGKIGFIGTVVKFLQDPLTFGLFILLPLVLLFAYNIYLIVKMIIADKTAKAREEALKEVRASQLDEEEIKRRAIEEYLASINKKEE